jgi:tRNA(fMet)-specific endonuclease VapC
METIKTVIDTDLLIDLLRNQKQATAFITELERKNLVLATTAINIFELHHGAHKSQESEKNLQAINVLVSRLSVLPLTDRAAKKAGHIYALLEQQGQPIGLRDTFIAAINRITGLSVITP